MRKLLGYYKLLLIAVMAIVVAASLSSAENASAAGDIVDNGGFETTVGTEWTLNNVDVVSGWDDHGGSNGVLIDLNAGSPGSISQSLSTFPGRVYDVSFWLGGNPQLGINTKTATVTAPGYSQAYTATSGPSTGNLDWTQYTFSFTATGYTSVLSFTSNGTNDASGPLVDDISVSDPGPDELGRSAWQMFHLNERVSGIGPFTNHGDVGNYAHVDPIPAVDATDTTLPGVGWIPAPNGDTVGFSRASRLGGSYVCKQSLDYTFFQTLVDIPYGTQLDSFEIFFSGMDDGSRVTLFNSANKGGFVIPGSTVQLGGSLTLDMTPYVIVGETNRVVVTQIDDCATGNNLITARIDLNGYSVTSEPNVAPVVDIDSVVTDNTVYYVDWTDANSAAGTASGVINLPNGETITVDLSADPVTSLWGVQWDGQIDGTLASNHYPSANYTPWVDNSNTPWAAYISTEVPNGPPGDEIVTLSGGNATRYTVTLSEPIIDPIMAILSLGAGGSNSKTITYEFDTPFTIVSQGSAEHLGCGTCLSNPAGTNDLYGTEGHGTIRFDGTMDTFSWTVPTPENWHGFTFAIRSSVGLAQDVEVDEGDTAINNGTWSDADDDDVDLTLGASVGDITQYANGTWDWSWAADDGDATKTVVITATDEHGLTDTATFDVEIANVAPVVDAGGDATVGEGVPFTYSGSFDDPGADTWEATVDYGDGEEELDLSGKTFELDHTYANAGTYTVTVIVEDDDQGVGSETLTVTVVNVAPVVSAGDDVTINEGGLFSGSGSFVDLGPDTWEATVDYGDGDGEEDLDLTGNTFALNHTYVQDGTYVVTVTVNDGDADGVDTLTVTVNNVAPVVATGLLGTGFIIVNNDEWTFSNAGFGPVTGYGTDPASATQFVENVANYFTGGEPGNFLAYSSNFGLNESALANAMTAAGHTWTVSTAAPFTLANLLAYDAVFLAGNVVDQAVLIAYMNAGGNVYIGAGTGWGDPPGGNEAAEEAAHWNTFLNAFGLDLATEYNGVVGNPAPASTHPVLDGVNSMFFYNGNSVSVTDASVAEILFELNGQGMLALSTIYSSVASNAIDENGLASLTTTFVDPGSEDVHTVKIDWGDNSAVESFVLPAGDRSFTRDHVYLNDGAPGPSSHVYTVGITVTDDKPEAGTASTDITVNNVDPVIANLSGTNVLENETSTATGTITDVGTLDTLVAEIDWGDGSDVEPVTISPVDGSFSETHQYLDDPSGLSSDDYTITVSVVDGDGGVDSASTVTTITNVAPAIVGWPTLPVQALSGDFAEFDVNFTDVGTQDTHATSTITWGAGSSTTTVTQNAGSGTISGSGQFFIPGTYPVTVTVIDDDGGEASVDFDVIVSARPLDIDVKPGSDVNPLNLNGNGVVPIAVYGGDEFDVTSLTVSTVTAGVTGTEATPFHNGHLELVNNDVYDDYVFHFREWELGIDSSEVSAFDEVSIYLQAIDADGRYFEGEDVVRINPNNGNSKDKNSVATGGKGGPKNKK